jgi:hypothetical protein
MELLASTSGAKSIGGPVVARRADVETDHREARHIDGAL